MTVEQLANVVTKAEYLEGLGYFKTLQDAFNEGKFLQDSDIVLSKDTTAADDYAASYTLSVRGVAQATKINIPKDFLVKSATLETVDTADKPYSGAVVGDKYIDFVINTKADGDGTAEADQHIYLPVNDLVDVYTAGNGLTESNNEFSVVIDSTNANGLSVGANGVALAVATTTAAGAMSAEDKAYIEGLKSATLADITQADIQALFTSSNP